MHFAFAPHLILCLDADMFFNQSGLGPLAAVVATEIVDASIRGFATGIAMVGTAIVSTATNYSTLPISSSLGYSTLFGLYSVANVLIAGFVYFCVVETKGRTLEQIQAGK